jgi:hypothetical protein
MLLCCCVAGLLCRVLMLLCCCAAALQGCQEAPHHLREELEVGAHHGLQLLHRQPDALLLVARPRRCVQLRLHRLRAVCHKDPVTNVNDIASLVELPDVKAKLQKAWTGKLVLLPSELECHIVPAYRPSNPKRQEATEAICISPLGMLMVSESGESPAPPSPVSSCTIGAMLPSPRAAVGGQSACAGPRGELSGSPGLNARLKSLCCRG